MYWDSFSLHAADDLDEAGCAAKAMLHTIMVERLPFNVNRDGGFGIPAQPEFFSVNDTPTNYGIPDSEADDFWFDLLIDTEKALLEMAGEPE
jgi:hypothetical protein